MADTVVASPATYSGQSLHGHGLMVWISEQTGYFFYMDNVTARIRYKKTTTGPAGFAAATPVTVSSPADPGNISALLSVMYDRDFGNDSTGTVIHIAWGDQDLDVFKYRRLDTSDDSLDTVQTLVTPVGPVYSGEIAECSFTKTANGRIILFYHFGPDEGSTGVIYSDDGGDNWSGPLATAPPYPGSTNRASSFLFPWVHWDGANEDFALVQWDSQANTFKVHVYDWSAGTYTAASMGGTEYTSNTNSNFAATYRQSDGHIFASGFDVVSNIADFWEISSTGQGNITTTEKGSLVTWTGYGSYSIGLTCVQKTGAIIGWYAIAPGIDATVQDAFRRDYTDAGGWGTPVQYTENLNKYYQRPAAYPLTINTAQGGNLCLMQWENDQRDYVLNETNSEAVTPGGGGGGGEDTPGVPILDPTYVQGIVTIT